MSVGELVRFSWIALYTCDGAHPDGARRLAAAQQAAAVVRRLGLWSDLHRYVIGLPSVRDGCQLSSAGD